MKELSAFAFPNDDEWGAKELPSLCKEIADHYQVIFFHHHGRAYYEIIGWENHQVTQRRAKRRYPTHDDPDSIQDPQFHAENSPAQEKLGTSLATQGDPRLGTGEQGNRGTGEQGKKSAPAKAGSAAKSPASIEHEITDAAYQEVGKAFNFIAVRQIAKWAIHDRGEDPEKVKEAIVGVYSLGKPITKQTLGQWLDGHIRAGGRMDRRTETLLREMDHGGSALQIEGGFFS